MRPLLILIAVLITAPAQAQRVFRASSLDAEQNERLDASERRDNEQDARLDRIEPSLARIEANVEKLTRTLTEKPAAEESAAAAEPERQVVAPDPSPASMPYSYLIKHGADWCEPCVYWDKNPRPTIERKWTIFDEGPDGRSVPWFEVVIGDKRYEHNGPLSLGDLHAIVDRHNGVTRQPVATKPVQRPVSARYSTAELRQQINALASNGWQRLADVSPRSAVKQHLMGSEHGFSWEQIAGLTQTEALIIHDYAPGHGNRIFPVRRGADAQVVTSDPGRMPSSPAPANVGCASGGCATNSFSSVPQVRGNFPIFRRLRR